MASTARRSTGPSEVIDLTGDSPDTSARTHSHSQHDYRNMPPPPTLTTHRATRPPRGFQEIIDLSDADESPMRPGLRAPQDDSPEVEFVGERTIPLGQREQRQRNLPTIIDFITFPNDGDDTDDDEVEITHVHHFREIMGPGRPHSFFDRLADRLHAQIHAPLHAARGARQDRPNRRRTNPRRAVHHAGFVAPDIDYAMAAFDMGMGSPPLVREPTPEAIIPPDPAPEGFTRDPREDDVLVCPSCGDELCQGGSDEKAQPWLIKTCGHVSLGTMIDELPLLTPPPRSTVVTVPNIGHAQNHDQPASRSRHGRSVKWRTAPPTS